MGDMVSPQVPLVLHLLLADLTGKLPADGVHVEDVLLQVELVAEHALAVLTHPRLPALPGGTQEGSHLENGDVKEGEVKDIYIQPLDFIVLMMREFCIYPSEFLAINNI